MHYSLMAYGSNIEEMMEPHFEHSDRATSLSKLRNFNKTHTVATEDIERFLKKHNATETLLIREDRLYDQDGNLNHVLRECLQAGVENVIVFDEYGRFRKWGHSVYNGKWDWFVLGGRWSGFLLAKPGATIPDTAIRGGAHENVMREAMNKLLSQNKKNKSLDMELLELPDDQYDRLPKGCIDLERMRKLKDEDGSREKIKERVDNYFLNPAKYDIRPYEEIARNYTPKSPNEFPVVTKYNIHSQFVEQPGMVKLTRRLKAEKLDFYTAVTLLDRDLAHEYLDLKYKFPWASSLRQGEWIDVVWGAIEPNDCLMAIGYLRNVARHWNDASDDELVTIVDCHT